MTAELTKYSAKSIIGEAAKVGLLSAAVTTTGMETWRTLQTMDFYTGEAANEVKKQIANISSYANTFCLSYALVDCAVDIWNSEAWKHLSKPQKACVGTLVLAGLGCMGYTESRFGKGNTTFVSTFTAAGGILFFESAKIAARRFAAKDGLNHPEETRRLNLNP